MTYLHILESANIMQSCEGEKLINVALGPSSETRATKLRSLVSTVTKPECNKDFIELR